MEYREEDDFKVEVINVQETLKFFNISIKMGASSAFKRILQIVQMHGRLEREEKVSILSFNSRHRLYDDEYQNFWQDSFRKPSPKVKEFHFFLGELPTDLEEFQGDFINHQDRYIGYCIVRPSLPELGIKATVLESVIKPLLTPHFYLESIAEYKVSIKGAKFKNTRLPFSSAGCTFYLLCPCVIKKMLLVF